MSQTESHADRFGAEAKVRERRAHRRAGYRNRWSPQTHHRCFSPCIHPRARARCSGRALEELASVGLRVSRLVGTYVNADRELPSSTRKRSKGGCRAGFEPFALRSVCVSSRSTWKDVDGFAAEVAGASTVTTEEAPGAPARSRYGDPWRHGVPKRRCQENEQTRGVASFPLPSRRAARSYEGRASFMAPPLSPVVAGLAPDTLCLRWGGCAHGPPRARRAR